MFGEGGSADCNDSQISYLEYSYPEKGKLLTIENCAGSLQFSPSLLDI